MSQPVQPVFVKTPNEILDYMFDWSNWLVDGDEISTATWTFESPLFGGTPYKTTTTTSTLIAGGVAGSKYLVSCLVNTINGLTGERSLYINVIATR